MKKALREFGWIIFLAAVGLLVLLRLSGMPWAQIWTDPLALLVGGVAIAGGGLLALTG